MPGTDIADNYRRIRDSLPPNVTLVVAAKGRTSREVAEVIEAGATVIGENYVQEAERVRGELGALGDAVEWHLIGHLQRNKVGRALPLFDVVQSLDSLQLARALDARAAGPVRAYLEVNVGGEQTKHGIEPGAVRMVVEEIGALPNVHIEGLMTMEPYCEDPEDARPHFRRMRGLFERLQGFGAPNVQMKVLSLGMSHSWAVAVDEGANMVRVGTAIFGQRPA